MLSKISQTQEHKYHAFSVICKIQIFFKVLKMRGKEKEGVQKKWEEVNEEKGAREMAQHVCSLPWIYSKIIIKQTKLGVLAAITEDPSSVPTPMLGGL